MKNNNILSFTVIITLLFSCGTSRRMNLEADFIKLGEKINDKTIQIEADWAHPLMTQGVVAVANSGLIPPGSNANRISLIGNPNHFRMAGDSVYINLPYFGEQRVSGGYGVRDVGIAFEGIPTLFEVRKDPVKKEYQVGISVRDEIETLRFNLTLFPSGRVDMVVNSSHRSTIRYSGRIVQEREE